MDVTQLKQGDNVQFIDTHSIARKGTVVRNRTTEQGKLFLTVESDHGIEVIQDSKKIISLNN